MVRWVEWCTAGIATLRTTTTFFRLNIAAMAGCTYGFEIVAVCELGPLTLVGFFVVDGVGGDYLITLEMPFA